MSDTRNGKPLAQDALGFLFCLVGGFFAVSIVLFLRGQEPKAGVVSVLAWPVVELVTLLGAWPALLFSSALAALGTVLFLRPAPLAALRPFLALLACALGASLILGALGGGGELGAWLPALVTGFLGRVIALVLGAALAWLGWSLFFGALPGFAGRKPLPGSAEAVQRIGLGTRHGASAGVTSAEAALLVNEPRPSAAHQGARREEPLRDETIRPYPPEREAPALEPRARRSEAALASVRATVEPLPSAGTTRLPLGPANASGLPVFDLTPPAPSWEHHEEQAEERETEPGALAAAAPAPIEEEVEHARGDEPLGALAQRFETEEVPEEELGSGTAAPPAAAWEQIGLFDEEEEEEEEAAPAKPATVELTPSLDFGAAEPGRSAHEPEIFAAEPLAAASAGPPEGEPESEPESEEEPDEARAAASERSATRPDVLVEPVPSSAPRSEPVAARDEESERWSRLVFDAGCVILEQKRVAVSMLERRFGIDFDQACRVLDELQQAGLIGPYMGGRTRDILLTREEWLPHAPHAS